jgi:hypothetical protein
MRKRNTIDREIIVSTANEQIAFLSNVGDERAQIQREAIIQFVQTILMNPSTDAVEKNATAYRGFSYLEKPIVAPNGEKVYDDTRIAFM